MKSIIFLFFKLIILFPVTHHNGRQIMIYQILEVSTNNHTFRLVIIIEINSTLVHLHLVPVSQEVYDIWVLEYIHDNFKCIIF